MKGTDMEKDSKSFLNPSQLQDRVQFFENRLLTYSEAAEYLSVSESYLRQLKAQKKIAFVPIGSRCVRFRVSSLNRWIEKKEMA
jgi:excisionase family DNA binding protein